MLYVTCYMALDQNIETLPNTSSITIRRFKSIGIETYWDLLNYFPFRYENYSLISAISKVQNGETVTIKGKILKFTNVFTKKGLRIQKATIADATGKIDAVWYNQQYLWRVLKAGVYVSISGEVKGFFHKVSFEVKGYEIINNIDSNTIHTGRLVPIYPEKKGLSSRLLREKIFSILNQLYNDRGVDGIGEFLPAEVVSYNQLLNEEDSYSQIHFPKNLEIAKNARERLAFDELFTIQLSAHLVRNEWDKENVGNPFMVETSLMTSLQEFVNNLPFELTSAQKRVVDEIVNDLKKKRPMNRFLEGDVGSGKTVVAAIACYLAYLNGFQSLFMAPTEILANQHFQTVKSLFSTPGVENSATTAPNIILITRTHKPIQKELDKADFIIGTHALLNSKLKFDRVGLIIIDEQHRFGVVQRAKLKEKGINPHLLTMTATPIPRTVALTLYGELDLSVIDEMPKGRLPVKTFLVPKAKRESGYLWIKKMIKEEDIQIFIICPLIEESEVETMKSVKAATKEFERLKNEVFSGFKLELLHGKVKSNEKDRIMKDFKENKFDILVATPVVEVGIDIPNAAIMIIEAAERFGLAQLHQLRGRVGRGEKQSYCFLYTESVIEEVLERLQFFAKTENGMQIAEYDLKRRGPGEIYGTRQHGYLNLKIASLSDYNLINKAKKAVNYFTDRYQVEKFPEIKRRLEEYRLKQISRD